MSGPLRLHWSPDSANLVIRMALEELGLSYDASRVDRARQQQRSPEYLRLNPQGLIPVLEDGDVVLFETGAILVHLAAREKRLGRDGAGWDDPAARAKFLKWTFWVSNTLHADLRGLFYTERYIQADQIPAAQNGLAKRVQAHARLIEAVLAEDRFLAGDTPTLVDFYLGACLRWAQLYPAAGPAAISDIELPRLRGFLEALQARPALRKAAAAEMISGPLFIDPSKPDISLDEIQG